MKLPICWQCSPKNKMPDATNKKDEELILMVGYLTLIEEVSDHIFDIHECDVEITVHYDFVKFILIGHFFF